MAVAEIVSFVVLFALAMYAPFVVAAMIMVALSIAFVWLKAPLRMAVVPVLVIVALFVANWLLSSVFHSVGAFSYSLSSLVGWA